jgi:cytochrome P450
VLQENSRNYSKGWDYRYLRPLLGNGLLTSEGEIWRRHRKLAQPAFHHESLVGFTRIMAEAAASAVERWRPNAESGQPIEVTSEMMRVTLEVVARALFGAAVTEDEIERVGHAMDEAVTTIFERSYGMDVLPEFFPTPRNLRFRRAVRDIDAVARRMIAARRKEPGADLLSRLLAASDEETGQGMSEGQLRDEVMTLFLAGHETTANLLSWTFHYLSLHPEVARELSAEAARVLGGRAPGFEDLRALEYTRAVLEETLRISPPVWWISRTPLEDDVVAGYAVPKGELVVISPYALHRNPAFWENPEGFDPRRFLGGAGAPASASARPKHAYVPFGAGPRVCIGNHFAMMEAQIILASIAQRYRLELVAGWQVRPLPQVTLRAAPGIRMRVRAS